MAKVLVVGGAGYVGGALTDHLLGTGHQVKVYDSLVYEESYRKPVDLVFGDVRDWDQLSPELEWADVVVWLAAIVGDGACALDPELTREINTASVARLAQRFQGRILFTSTCSVYGASEKLLDESSPVKPLSLYAETKLAAEGHLRGKNVMIFRLGTLFGIGDTYSRIRMDLVLNLLTAKAVQYGNISVFGKNQHRPLLHVKDAAAAIARNIETEHTGIFNLHAVNTRIADLADRLVRHFPHLKVNGAGAGVQDHRTYRASSKKAIATFGFDPKYSLDDGIEELKVLFQQGRIKRIGLPRQSNHRYLKQLFDVPSSPLGCEVRPDFQRVVGAVVSSHQGAGRESGSGERNSNDSMVPGESPFPTESVRPSKSRETAPSETR